MFGRLRSLFRPQQKFTDPYEQFVVAFVEECKRQGRMPSNYDHNERCFIFDDLPEGSQTVFLENAFRVWQERDGQARAEHLQRFVRSLLEGPTETVLPPVEIMPGVRSRSLISVMLIRNERARASTQDEAKIAWAPLCGELASIVMHNGPDTLRPLTGRDLDRSRLSFDEAMSLATANLRAQMPAPDFEPQSVEGLFLCRNLEDLQSSLLLLTPDADFRFPALYGEPVAHVPSRNLFFVTGSQNRAGLETLINLADIAHESPHYLSSTLVVWRNGRWNDFVLEGGSDLAAKQRMIGMRDLGLDYQQQKGLLDQLHAEQESAVVVPEYMAFQPQPGSEFSVTILASATQETLLPKTDRLRFVDADQVRESLDVAWDDALAIAGSLFEPVPELYPPRYRMRGFPPPEVWNELEKKSLLRPKIE